LTENEFERIFGTNHLRHFLLTNFLLPLIDPNGQVVIASSNVQNPPPTFTGKISSSNSESRAFPEKYSHNVQKGMRYCESKLCNIYFTYD
jgi:NAD(P)-dependent dehydrogenase (short-subunit alcohol dehydrogenase family)